MIHPIINNAIDATANPAIDAIVPLQQRLADASPTSSAAAAPGTGPNAALDAQAIALLAALRQLPPPASNAPADKQAHINAIAKLLRQFKNSNGAPAFITLEQQRAALQRALALTSPEEPLRAPLTTATMSAVNLQFQMKQWMQDVMLSDGTPPEFQNW
ncbi:hypothetical protein [Chromobacterium vaccinii]|uniref:hypothetical protein n=1 Tax=Chromobacterium vaccinii TaxID=1108595 RepID=UPI001E626C4B|nr:hypothetical protein [Chromobacterium vaccinii]MCD4498771.1 hypothetical protein [Chromobacterium vaccinii]